MKKTVHLLEKAVDAINRLVEFVMAAAIAAIFLLLAGQVILRYLVFAPFNWVEEGATYLMAILTLLGMGVLLRDNIHLRVDLFTESLANNPATRWLGRGLQIVAFLAAASLGGYLASAGWSYAWAGRNELSPSGSFVVFWPRLAISAGAFLLTVQSVILALRVLLPMSVKIES